MIEQKIIDVGESKEIVSLNPEIFEERLNLSQRSYSLQHKNGFFHFREYIYKASHYHYNWHPEVEILIVLKGRLEVCYDNTYTILEEGAGIVFYPQCGHATLALEDDAVAMVMHIAPELFQRYLPDFLSHVFVLSSRDDRNLQSVFGRIRQLMARCMLWEVYVADNPLKTLFWEQSVLAIVLLLAPEIVKRRNIVKNRKVVRESQQIFERMIAYIDKNYRRKIELQDIAAVGGYHVGYTSQFFKRQIGITFKEYLMRIRLREAAVQLVNTDDLIVEIANRNGFADVKAFNVAFRKHFHQTPSEYRKSTGNLRRKEQNYHADWKEFIPLDNREILEILRGYSLSKEIYASQVYATKTVELRSQEIIDTLEGLLKTLKES